MADETPADPVAAVVKSADTDIGRRAREKAGPLVDAAIGVLIRAMSDKAPWAVRVDAAKTIIKLGMRDTQEPRKPDADAEVPEDSDVPSWMRRRRGSG